MSSEVLNVFCKVGFSRKKKGEGVEFHHIDGRPYGARLQIPDGVNYLSPYSPEDLLTGKIPYDLLPVGLQNAIGEVAQRTFEAMARANPDHMKRDKIGTIVIAFELSTNTAPISEENESGSGGMLN